MGFALPAIGYEWVQDGDELVLIDIGNGIIANVFIIPG
jgi:Ni/Co efflux regulator RcnB